MACLHHQCSILVDGSCYHSVPWVLAHWHGLSSDEGFINSGSTFQHLTIYWNLLSWNNLRKEDREGGKRWRKVRKKGEGREGKKGGRERKGEKGRVGGGRKREKKGKAGISIAPKAVSIVNFENRN